MHVFSGREFDDRQWLDRSHFSVWEVLIDYRLDNLLNLLDELVLDGFAVRPRQISVVPDVVGRDSR